MSLDRAAQHLVRFVDEQNAERIELVFDEDQPIGSTAYSRVWYTTRQTRPTRKSQISDLIVDSAWAFRFSTSGTAPGAGSFRIS